MIRKTRYLLFPLATCTADQNNCGICNADNITCDACHTGYTADVNGVCKGIIFVYTAFYRIRYLPM